MLRNEELNVRRKTDQQRVVLTVSTFPKFPESLTTVIINPVISFKFSDPGLDVKD